jgi:hypothetical protein
MGKNMLPNKTIIRSIYVVDDKIYSGSIKNLGIGFCKYGKMNCVAERKSGFDDSENEEIWKIFEFKNIYFQSFNAIYNDGSSIKKN